MGVINRATWNLDDCSYASTNPQIAFDFTCSRPFHSPVLV